MDLLRPGALYHLPAVARQKQRADVSSVRRWQMSALLFLLHRPRSGTLLPARTHLVPFSSAVLLQWPQLAGAATGPQKGRLHAVGQRLHRHCRLDVSPELGRQFGSGVFASQAGLTRQTILPHPETDRGIVSLYLR